MTLRSTNCWLKTNQLVFTKKTLQLLATEILKSKTGVSPEFMSYLPFRGKTL